MDEGKLKKQLAYLVKIRGMSSRDLRLHYRKVFANSKYYVRPTLDIPRDWIEQRCFYAYCIAHPCYPAGSEELKIFEHKAKEVFLTPPPLDIPKDKLMKEEMKKRVLFTRQNIKRMDIKEVDAYLALFGLTVTDQPPKVRRYVLWELYNKRASDLVKLTSRRNSRKLATRPASEIDNKFVLTDLILRWPRMGWPEFQETFGEVMPKVSKQSFYNTRGRLRKQYPHLIPELLKGRRGARITPVRTSHKGKVAPLPVDMTVLDIETEEFNT